MHTPGRSCVLMECSVLQVILKEKVKELNLHEVSNGKESLTFLFLTLGVKDRRRQEDAASTQHPPPPGSFLLSLHPYGFNLAEGRWG